MSSLGSESVLYDSDGSPLAVDNGVAIPSDTPLLISGGSDGTNARYIKIDSSGNQIMVGLGTAGSPSGGVISIQGVASGTAVPISGSVSVTGSVTTTNASIGSNGSAIPTSSTQIGGSDGTNLQALRVFDADTGGGTQYVLGVNLRLSAGGGSVEFGTNSNPIRVDPTGTTTQPISGTITANAGTGNFTVVQSTASNLRAQLASESSTGAAIPSTAVMVGGSDGANLRALFVDSSGRQIIVGAAANGAAVAGNPVLIGGSDGTNARSIRTATDGTVRVDPTGTTTQPVSAVGNFNDASVGSTGSAVPASASYVGFNDGTNLQGARVFDVDTGAGTQYVVGVGLRKAASGGSVELGTSSDPIRIDPTGTTTQPINITQVASSSVSTAATGVQKVGIVGGTGTSLETTAGVLDYNLKNVANSAVATSATGVQKVGIVGNAGATTDATLAAGTAPTNGFGQLAQYNTTQPAPTNTQTVSAQSDQSGNLLQFPGVQTKTGAVWNSSTTINTLQFPTGTATAGAPLGSLSVLIQLNQTSTFSAGAVTFQGTYDGTNWVTIPTAQILHPQTLVSLSNPYTFVASTNQPFLIQLQGFQQVRMNLTSTITGTGTVTPFWTILSNPPTQAITTLSGGYGGQIEGRAADGATPVGNPVLIGGSDGANTQTILTDTSGRIVIAPSGASTISGFSFGDVALSSITTSVVRRTTYNEQTTNAQRSIASSNANDTSAGTGARQVKIIYYDSTGAGPYTETVTLNGTTAVATSNTNICFIEEMSVVSVGSGGVNAGIITLYVNNSGGGGTIGTIATGDNATYWSHHYVPTGKTNFITSLSVVVNGGGALFFVRAQTIGVSTAPNVQVSDYVRSATQSGTSTRIYGTPIQTVGPARLLMYVTTEANTSLTYRGAFDYYDE